MQISTGPSWLKYLIQAAVVAGVTLALTDLGRFSLSAEGRLNAAFPQSVVLTAQVDEVLGDLPASQRSSVQDELEARLKLRALTCARGYSPAWGSSTEEIHRNIADVNCFTQADEEMSRWLGILRIGPLLAAPPLRPIPKRFEIRSAKAVNGAIFAANAGVVALIHQDSYDFIDMNSQVTLLTLKKQEDSLSNLSPNGRLFMIGGRERAEVRKVEDGALVASLPGMGGFSWLNDNTALYSQREQSVVRLIDFSSLKEVDVPGVREMNGVLPVPGEPDQFVIGSFQGASKFAIDRSGALPQLRLLQRLQQSGASSWASNTSSLTADGRHYVSGREDLHILSLESMRLETVDLGPYRPQGAFGTWDPDLVFLMGFLKFELGKNGRCYLYSISGHTFADVTCNVFYTRPFFIRSLGKLGMVTDSGIDILDGMPSGEPVSHFDQITAWNSEEVQARQAREALASFGRSAPLAPAREFQFRPQEDGRSLYKCQLPEGKVVYQSTACPQGSESQRMEIKADPARESGSESQRSGSRMGLRPGSGAEAARRYAEEREKRWFEEREQRRQERQSPAATRSGRQPAAPASAPAPYVPPTITEPEVPLILPPSAALPTGQRCPFTLALGKDPALETEKMSLHAELFYINSGEGSATMPAPAAGENRPGDTRRLQCSALVDEYQRMGEELLKVPPRSIPQVRSCFRTEAQRLDTLARQMRCNIEHAIKLKH